MTLVIFYETILNVPANNLKHFSASPEPQKLTPATLKNFSILDKNKISQTKKKLNQKRKELVTIFEIKF